jgi:hypothetical protein
VTYHVIYSDLPVSRQLKETETTECVSEVGAGVIDEEFLPTESRLWHNLVVHMETRSSIVEKALVQCLCNF